MAGCVGGWESDYIATSVQPTGFSHRSECGKNKNPLCLTVRRLRNREALFSCLAPNPLLLLVFESDCNMLTQFTVILFQPQCWCPNIIQHFGHWLCLFGMKDHVCSVQGHLESLMEFIIIIFCGLKDVSRKIAKKNLEMSKYNKLNPC